MVSINIHRDHHLPPYDLKRRIDRRYEELKQRFNYVLINHSSSWCPNERKLEASCKFRPLDLDLYGKVEIKDAYVHIEGELPSRGIFTHALQGFVKRAETRARRELDYILSANYRC